MTNQELYSALMTVVDELNKRGLIKPTYVRFVRALTSAVAKLVHKELKL